MKQFIKECQEAYYTGQPIISNEEYDVLVQRFPDAEDSIGPVGEVEHLFRMYSLQKKYPGRGDELPSLLPYTESPKLDGCAVDLLYVDGKLAQALTRGNGIKGSDVTANLMQIVPTCIDYAGLVQVTGEVCTTRDVPNARNYASGAVNLDSDREFHSRVVEGGLLFVAYGVQTSKESGLTDTYEKDMELLYQQEFYTITSPYIVDCAEDGIIPTDGTVYRLNNNKAFYAAGYTSKFPKGAFAVKEDAEGEITTIEDIVWQVGASGKVTPVAIVAEVILEDARVTRVTLNNVAYMEAMGITHIGQEVRVIRAGGIIPKIVEAY